MILSLMVASMVSSVAHARQEVPELDELWPSLGHFSLRRAADPYKVALGRALLEEDGIRKCQLLAIPSFDREWAVYLHQEDRFSSPSLVFRRMKTQLYSDLMEEISDHHRMQSYADEPDDQAEALKEIRIEVESFVAPLGAETVELLEQVWLRMLERVRCPEFPRFGHDGVSYHLGHWDWQAGVMSGETRSPKDGTRVAALVEIADKLAELAQASPGSRAPLETAVIARARSLLDRLDREPEVIRAR